MMDWNLPTGNVVIFLADEDSQYTVLLSFNQTTAYACGSCWQKYQSMVFNGFGRKD